MLTHLSIRNYALISQLDIGLDQGFTAITGETGAGKSILLGALSLILGQRSDSQVLQDKSQKCIVEGVFDIKNYSLSDFFEKHNLDYEEKTIIRREINPSGNSRAFINDTPVSLQQLKELGVNLVDVHSQHESLLLNSAEFQFNIVDSFAGQNEAVRQYKTGFRAFLSLQNELKALLEREQKSKLDKDYFQFQFDELEKANLQGGEQEQLEQELEIQNNSEVIKKNIFESTGALSRGEGSVLSILSEIKKFIADAARYSHALLEIEQRLKSASIELEDIAAELEKIGENISFSSEKMEAVNSRLDIIYSLQQKHRVKTVAELLEAKENFHQKLGAITLLDNDIEKLNNRILSEKGKLEKLAWKISQNRNRAIPQIEKNVNSMLKELGMPGAKIEISNLTAGKSELANYGIDNIKFFFTANKGSEPKEIQKVASGGELSRVMLSLKSLVARLTALPTIIFDEIDAGVSGEIADKVGTIMKKMAGGMQVISITHLPQIAGKGDSHFFVYKENKNGAARTFLKKLSEKERINEVARLLSGEELTQAAIENAKELLRV